MIANKVPIEVFKRFTDFLRLRWILTKFSSEKICNISSLPSPCANLLQMKFLFHFICNIPLALWL